MRILTLTGAVAIALAAAVHAPAAFAQRPVDAARGVPFGTRGDVRAFAAEVAADTGLDRARVERWLAAARHVPRITELMSKPLVEPPAWFEYAPPFLSAERIAGGVAWWRENEDALARAEARWGVPPEIVVAIVGVETYYGRLTGSFRVIDALATLAFDYPRRATFFRGELKEYLVLSREQGFSPLVPKGSFAGAMGVPQFMPGSFRRYAVDFDGDARVDLWGSGADVVGSVANYLARHDWTPGGPTIVPAAIAEASRATVLRRLDGGISERRPLEAWASDGVSPALAMEPVDEPVGLLMLEESGEDASYWIACPNFFVITRYNRSRLYASAVVQLAEAIRAARNSGSEP
ncbi:membrane-bound lytic murein transglycosylase B [Burkholderiales bacterium]|nr:membrane-bound lytic murein transglycosylase B [Burkholderiales bacterium]